MDVVGGLNLTPGANVAYAAGKNSNAADCKHATANSQLINTSAAGKAEVGAGGLTMFFWYNPYAGAPATQVLLPQKYNAQAGTFEWYLEINPSTGVLSFLVSGGDGDGAEGTISNVTTTANAFDPTGASGWYFLVLTYDPSDRGCHIYVNDAEATYAAGTLKRDAGPLFTGGDRIDFGYSSANSGANGLVDEIAIYDTLLSASQLTELYNAGAGKFYPFS